MRSLAAVSIGSLLLSGCSLLFATGEWSHESIDAKYDAAVKSCQFIADEYNSAQKNFNICVARFEQNRATEHYRADRPWSRDQGHYNGDFSRGFVTITNF